MSITALQKRIEQYDSARRNARRVALARAAEEVHEEKIEMLRELYRVSRDGKGVSAISNETGLARTTVYRYLEEYEEIAAYISEPEPGEGSSWTIFTKIGEEIDTPWGKRPAERTRVLNKANGNVYDLEQDHRGNWTLMPLGGEHGNIEYNGIGEPFPASQEDVQWIIDSIKKEEK